MQTHIRNIGGQSLSLMKEFRQFAIKGNVVDMAVGIIIGAAFGKIVSSLVADVIMPPLGFLIGGVNFTHLVAQLKDPSGVLPPVDVKYGQFIQTIVDFTIVALSVFVMVKIIAHIRSRTEIEAAAAPPPPSNQEVLLKEIRDLLAENAKR